MRDLPAAERCCCRLRPLAALAARRLRETLLGFLTLGMSIELGFATIKAIVSKVSLVKVVWAYRVEATAFFSWATRGMVQARAGSWAKPGLSLTLPAAP